MRTMASNDRMWFDVNWRPRFMRLALSATSGVGAPAGAGAGSPPSTGGGGSGAGSPPPPAPATGAPAGSPPAPASAPSGQGAPPASPTGAPGQGGQPSPADPNAANIEVLRQSHEMIRKFGSPEAAQRALAQVQTWNNLRTEATELARTLGYTPESLEDAFNTDPADTIAYLREQARQNDNRPPDPNRALDERLRPIEDNIRQQKAQAANQWVDTGMDSLFSQHAVFKDRQDVPPDVKNVVFDMVRESIKYDRKLQTQILQGQQTEANAGLKTVFDGVMDRFFKTVNAYNAWFGKAPATGSPAPSNGGAPPNGGAPKPWSLSDLIDGSDDAFQGLQSTRR